MASGVYTINTQDPQTFASQVRKVAECFGCTGVTFVGDRGMIKSMQIEDLPEDFHYITAITKPQIESLLKKGVIQLGLFEDQVCEAQEDQVRYVLRRNPVRSEEIERTRLSKFETIEKFVEKKNRYLLDHPRARVLTGIKEVIKKMVSLKVAKWLDVKSQDRVLSLEKNEEALKEESFLDGCYAIKTDLTKEAADSQMVHDRYKDLIEVEMAFRVANPEELLYELTEVVSRYPF